jgi:REP element-mobilizing transposase RayT
MQGEDCFYHVTSRGDDRKPIYKSERDFEKFLEYVTAAKDRFKFYLYAYCLMNNHYHLLIETTQANLSKIMQYINTAYTVYYNVKRKRSGHLFQGRYKSILVEQDAYFAELTRYIHLNPVRAKMVDGPEKYDWSSYRAYVQSKKGGCVDVERAELFLGMDMRRYREFVDTRDKKDSDLFKNVCAGFILGGEEFVKDKLNQLQNDIETKDFAHKRAVKNIIDPDDIIRAVTAHYGIDAESMRGSGSRPRTAKKMAIYLLRRKTGLTNAQIGELFGMRYAAVSMAGRGFEDKLAGDKKLRAVAKKINLKFEV